MKVAQEEQDEERTASGLGVFSSSLRRSVINIARQDVNVAFNITFYPTASCQSGITFALPCYETGLGVPERRCVAFLTPQHCLCRPGPAHMDSVAWPCAAVCTRGGNTALIGRGALLTSRTRQRSPALIGRGGAGDVERCIIRGVHGRGDARQGCKIHVRRPRDSSTDLDFFPPTPPCCSRLYRNS